MFEEDNRMELIRPILIDNGFSLVENKFFNDKCTVEVDLENEVFNVFYVDKHRVDYMLTSENLNLYFLFGFLSANELIDRNFKL